MVGNVLWSFLILRLTELFLAVIVLTAIFMIFGHGSELTVQEGNSLFADIFDVLIFSASLAMIYYFLLMYFWVTLLVFLVVEMVFGINQDNIRYVNTVPYTLYSLPILLGWLGGGAASVGLWMAWIIINFINYSTPRILSSLILREQRRINRN